MKTIANTLLGMFFIAGLLMAGSEATTVGNQFVMSMAGLIIFAGSAYGLSRVNRG